MVGGAEECEGGAGGWVELGGRKKGRTRERRERLRDWAKPPQIKVRR